MNANSTQQWFEAAEKNDVPRLRKYYTKNKMTLDKQGRSALMHAAANGAVEAIKFLLEDEKNVVGPSNWTALMEAVVHGQIRAVELLAPHVQGQRLLEKHPIYKQMTTALDIAAQDGNSAAVTLLLAEMDVSGWDSMHQSAFFYNLGEILHNYQTPTKIDLLKRSPVFYAVFANPQWTASNESDRRRYTQTIHALCRLPNALDQPLDVYGKSPLHYAVEINNIAAVKALCKYYCMIGTSRACHSHPVNTTALMIAVELENVAAVAILTKYEHGAKNEHGTPAIQLANDIKKLDIRKQILEYLYFRERQVLIKQRVGSVLNVSTFEHNLSIEESQSLHMSSKVYEDFNSILENVTEDNRDQVCEYLCQKLSRSQISRSRVQNSQDLSFSSLFSKNMDNMHEIVNGILDVLLEKSVANQKSQFDVDCSANQNLSAYLEQPQLGQDYRQMKILIDSNQQLSDENQALRNRIKDLTRKYSDLEIQFESKGVGSFLADAVDELAFSRQLDVQDSKVHHEPLNSRVRLHQDDGGELFQSNQMLQSQLNEAQIEIQRLFEENEMLKKYQAPKNDYYPAQFSDSTLKISNGLSISADKQNPFKYQEAGEQSGQPDSQSSADRNVFLSVTSASSAQNPMFEQNKRINDLELQNRQLKEDIRINVFIYEEKIQQLSDRLKQFGDENKHLSSELDQLINENTDKEQELQTMKQTLTQYEEEAQNNSSDMVYLNEQIGKLQTELQAAEAGKQYTAEYITDLINDLLESQQKASQQKIDVPQPCQLDDGSMQLEAAIYGKDSALQKVILLQSTVEQQQQALQRMQSYISQQTQTNMNYDRIIKQLDSEIKEVVGTLIVKYDLSIPSDIPIIEQLHQAIHKLNGILKASSDKIKLFDQNLNKFMSTLSQYGSSLMQSISYIQANPDAGHACEGELAGI